MPFTPPTTYASQGSTGYQAQFFIGTVASPISYTAVKETKSIKPNFITVPEVETSHLLSPNNTEEMLPGMIKPGTIEISGNWLGDSSQTALSDLAQAGTVAAWKITAPVQGLTKTFTATGSGFVTKFDVGPFEKNKPNEFTATVQMTGSYTTSVA